MVQGYYTLEESASLLGMSPDALKQLARKGEIRSFQDRGTWRFRIQDIQEMSRRNSQGSDAELPALGETPAPKPTDSPAPRSPKPQKQSDDVFTFALDSKEDDLGVDLGADVPAPKTPASGSGKRTSSAKRLPPPGSDSDVRLVAEGSDVSFKLPPDSDVKVGDLGPKSGTRSKTGMGSGKGPKSSRVKLGESTPERADSGVRLVPLDSDSDVRIVAPGSDDIHVGLGALSPKSATDSEIRLEGLLPAGPPNEGPLTEEINLDEVLKEDEERRQAAAQRRSQPSFPKTSPFDLSESQLNLAPLEDEAPTPRPKDDSSDFELSPADDASPLELSGSDDFKLEIPDEDEITLEDDGKTNLKPPVSGINLGKPADSGISLEQRGQVADEDDFELTLDAEPPRSGTPKPGGQKLVEPVESDSSEFELSLDADQGANMSSDSEFELTLDDSGGLAALEDEVAEEKDIFETDFDVPVLEDESGSDAVAVADADTDLDSSEFEIGEDFIAEDESGSVVVALDEEGESDDAAETVHRGKRGKKRALVAAGDDAGEFADLDEIDADYQVDEEDAEPAMARQTVVQQSAPWGMFPVAVLLPCVIIMVLVGLMGFELVQTQQGYKPGLLTGAIGRLIDGKK